jgi:hypothetical protein
MLIKIGFSFNAREARELAAEIRDVLIHAAMNNASPYPILEKMKSRLQSPLAVDNTPAPPARVLPPEDIPDEN